MRRRGGKRHNGGLEAVLMHDHSQDNAVHLQALPLDSLRMIGPNSASNPSRLCHLGVGGCLKWERSSRVRSQVRKQR